MELSTESNDRMIVVSVEGRLDFGTSGAFQRALESAVLEANGRTLIVDCSLLYYVSSTGLRSFLIGARTAQSVGIRFLVCGMQKFVAEVFQVGGFSTLILTFPDRAAAEATAVT
jgi:anti-anti-sigma factor